MKILSTYKDYYDYLTGVWGEDPLLVLDRREFQTVNSYKYELRDPGIRTLYIGNYCVEFFAAEGTSYFGRDLLEYFGEKVQKAEDIHTYHRPSIERKYGMKWEDLLQYGLCQIKDFHSNRLSQEVLLKPFPCKRPEYLSPETVIGFGTFRNKNSCYDLKYPILKDLGVNRLVPPETIYRWITEYLSEQKLKQEQHLDLRTDTQKLEGKGFDKRTSFRPNIKV